MNTSSKQRVDLPPTRTLAELYEKQGLRKEAAAVYRELIARDPDDEGLKEDLARLEQDPASDDERHGRPDTGNLLSHLESWLMAVRLGKRRLSSDFQKVRLLYISVVGGNRGKEDSFAPIRSPEGLPTDVDESDGDSDLLVDHWRCASGKALADGIFEAFGNYDALIIQCEDEAICGDTARQALSSLTIPIVEIFPGRHRGSDEGPVNSTIASTVTAQLVGFGEKSYSIAVRAAADMVRDLRNEEQEFSDEKQA